MVFKTRYFQRWLRKSGLTDEALCIAVREMQSGLVDAYLGDYVVKKRVAIGGRGKRGGMRVLLATNKRDRWFFVFGFAKNARENVTSAEVEALQALALDLLQLTHSQLAAAIGDGSLLEICHGR